MNRPNLYEGLTKIAWAYVLLLVDLNLGSLNLLPNWAGYLLIGRAIPLLAEERRDLVLLKPFCLALGLWSAVDWLLTLFGLPLPELFQPLNVVARVISIYFSFQLLSDLAALAERYQDGGWTLDRNLRACRNVTAVLSVVPFLPLPWENGAVQVLAVLLVLFQFLVSLLILYYLFSLRKGFEAAEAAD